MKFHYRTFFVCCLSLTRQDAKIIPHPPTQNKPRFLEFEALRESSTGVAGEITVRNESFLPFRARSSASRCSFGMNITSSGNAPSCLGPIPDRPWADSAQCLGHLGLPLGRLGAPLGHSWGTFGAPWAVFGAPWAVFGALLGHLGPISDRFTEWPRQARPLPRRGHNRLCFHAGLEAHFMTSQWPP